MTTGSDGSTTSGFDAGSTTSGADGQFSGLPAAPAYHPYPPVPPYPPAYRPTNNLALASLIVSLVSLISCPLIGGVGVYLGNRARSEISRSGENGAGLAQAGVIVGWCALGLAVLSILFFAAYFIFMAVVFGATLTSVP